MHQVDRVTHELLPGHSCKVDLRVVQRSQRDGLALVRIVRQRALRGLAFLAMRGRS